MAYQKLQSREALAVIKSDTVRIPDPSSVVVLDTATGATVGVANFGSTTLIDSGTKFTEAGIKPGMIVYNTTSSKAYTVVSVDSDIQLTITGAASGGATDSYSIYANATNGCTLFVGSEGGLTVRMAEVKKKLAEKKNKERLAKIAEKSKKKKESIKTKAKEKGDKIISRAKKLQERKRKLKYNEKLTKEQNEKETNNRRTNRQKIRSTRCKI